VPIGAFLSGGIDSSIIVGEMSRYQSVKTFAVGFAEPGYSELPYARLVAEHFHTEHHEVLVSGEDLMNYWPLLTWHQDEPMCEPSALGMYLVARLARQHVTVALSGEGGDELFAGYPKYLLDSFSRYYQRLPAHMRNAFMAPLLERLPYFMRKFSLAASALNEPIPRRWINWFGTFSATLKQQLLTPAWQARVDMDAGRIFAEVLARSPQFDDLASMLYLDTVVWLPDDLLMKNDKMTMAASLEARMPLLDEELMTYAASIPSQEKVRGWQTKYLLKQAYADFLPSTILQRKKMGFNVPVGNWFRAACYPYLRNLLLSPRARGRGIFQMATVERLLEEHREGRINHQARLFALASLEHWFRVYIDPPTLAMPRIEGTKVPTGRTLFGGDNRPASILKG
jgi:asparagine synthase (glutamine-hydrolysing)